MFLVGQERQDKHQQDLVEESKIYGDLLQESFIDTYANLTLKSVMLLRWFSRNCNNSALNVQTKYVLKTDDDTYVNIPELYNFVQSNKNPDLLMGCLTQSAPVIIDPHHKWFVPIEQYDKERFPDYLQGSYIQYDRLRQRCKIRGGGGGAPPPGIQKWFGAPPLANPAPPQSKRY